MTPDPAVWYQRRPGSAAWYKRGVTPTAYFIKVCARCGQEALMVRKSQFCSLLCAKGSGDPPNYYARHKRVVAARGRAKDQVCADCSGPAREWSQIHGTDGTDPEHYEPRCRGCHLVYDGHLGENHANAKLTDAQRRGIRASVGATQQELAEHFGVSQQTISNVLAAREADLQADEPELGA